MFRCYVSVHSYKLAISEQMFIEVKKMTLSAKVSATKFQICAPKLLKAKDPDFGM